MDEVHVDGLRDTADLARLLTAVRSVPEDYDSVYSAVQKWADEEQRLAETEVQ